MSILRFIEKNFGLVICSGVLIGLGLGQFVSEQNAVALKVMDWVIVVGLFLLLLCSMLKINLLDFFKDFKRGKFIIFLTILKLIILPLLVFLVAQFLPIKYLPGLMLLAAVPAAVAMPGLMILLRGDVKSSLVLSVVTNLLVPFTLPLIFYYTLGTKIDFDLTSMFLFLFSMVFVPFLIALPLQIYCPNFVKKVSKYVASIISIEIFIFMIAVVMPYSNEILGNIESSLISFILIIGAAIVFHIVGYMPFFKSSREDKVTGIILLAYSNTGLGIALASQYFDGLTVIMTVLYEFIWAAGLVLMQRIFAGKN